MNRFLWNWHLKKSSIAPKDGPKLMSTSSARSTGLASLAAAPNQKQSANEVQATEHESFLDEKAAVCFLADRILLSNPCRHQRRL